MMGVEFLESKAPAFRKGRDKARRDMCTPDLFKVQPTLTPTTYVASLHNGTKLEVGDTLGMRLEGDAVVLRQGLQPIGTLDRPTPELRQNIALSYNECTGTVHVVYGLSNRIEVSAS